MRLPLFKRKTLWKSLIVPLVLVMMFQTALSFGTLYAAGTMKRLNQNAYDLLGERVVTRKNEFENNMTRRWTAFGDSEEVVFRTLNAFETSYGEDALDDLTREYPVLVGEPGGGYSERQVSGADIILREIMAAAPQLLRGLGVTSWFLMLENGRENADERAGIYLLNDNPNSANGSLSIYAAPYYAYMGMTGVVPAVNNYWFTLTGGEENPANDYYYKPFNALTARLAAGGGARTVNHLNYKYWSLPHRMFTGGKEMDDDTVSCSVPLIFNGRIAAVLGIEVSVSQLGRIFDAATQGTVKESYYIGVDTDGSGRFRNVYTDAGFIQLYAQKGYLSAAAHSKYEDAYLLSSGVKGERVGAGLQYFRLYDTNTPFEGERWAMIGFMAENEITEFSRTINLVFISATLATLILGLVAVTVICRMITKPISRLTQKVKDSDPLHPVPIERINVYEVDQLVAEVENLSRRVAEDSAKLSRIISLAGIPIGAFEYSPGSDKVYYTENFFANFGIGVGGGQAGYMDAVEFRDRLAELERFIEERVTSGGASEITYRQGELDSDARWTRLRVIEEGERRLGVCVDITEEMRDRMKLEYERNHDLLTQLINRRAFHDEVVELFSEPAALRIGAMVMFDLDDLKYINDTYGHDGGDAYIRAAADVLRANSGENALAARMSGDEFYLFLWGYESKADVRARLAEIMQDFRSTYVDLTDNNRFKLRISAGVAFYPKDSLDYSQLMAYADFAMYSVKKTVKGQIKEFVLTEYDKHSYLLHYKEELNRLIDEELVTYHFQPIVDARSGEVYGYEALMRSQLKTLKNPAEILELARAQSKLYKIEELTMKKAIETFSGFSDEVKSRKLFLNSIPNQIISPDAVAKLETDYPELLDHIVLEYTEDEKMNEHYSGIKNNLINKWGALIAIDDFGKGFSGDLTLLTMQPDLVKIDMEIVQNIHADPARMKLLRNILSYAHERGIRVIAEGVETAEDLKALIWEGVDYVQGYYLARPGELPSGIPAATKEFIRASHKEYEDGRMSRRKGDRRKR